MKLKLFLLVLAVILLVPGIAAWSTVSTLHMDSISQKTDGHLIFTGHSDAADNVWFVYGGRSGVYSSKTKNVTITSAGIINATIKSGYYPGEPIYVRLANKDGYSSEEQTITLTAITPMPTTTYKAGATNITRTNLDPLKIMKELPNAYADHMGAPSHETGMLIFWGFVVSCIFIVLYLRSENVMTPALLGLVLGWVLTSFVPGDFKLLGQALLVVALGALLFTIVKGRIR